MDTFEGKLETIYHSTSEIGQQTKVRMAMAERKPDRIRTLHTLFLCRDFLNDVLWWESTGTTNGSCYGFKHNPKTNPIVKDKTTILLDLDETTLTPEDYIKSAAAMFGQLEKGLKGIEKTVFTAIAGKNTKKAVLVEGDKVWQKCAPLLSIYTCFLRVACRKDYDKNGTWRDAIKGERTNEAQYLRTAGLDESEALFRSAPKWLDVDIPGNAGWKAKAEIHVVHNMGFQNFLLGMKKTLGPVDMYREHCLLHDLYGAMA